jgi:hypothetical protein
MSQEVVRPLTSKELANFAGHIGVHRGVTRTLIFLLSTVFAMGILSAFSIMIAHSLPQKVEEELIASFLLPSIAVALLIDRKTKCPPHSKKFLGEFKQGAGIVRSYDVIEAVRVREFEDNGYAFYLKLKDGGALYLMGQYLYEPTDQKRFPSTELELVYSPISRLVLGLTCKGSYLEPVCELPAPIRGDFESRKIPESGSVVAMDFEALKCQAINP